MKKNILYLLAFVTVIFASCDPLKDTFDEIKSGSDPKTIAITTTSSYTSPELANTGIATMLNTSYAHLPNGTKANVTYSYGTNTVKPVDSVYANIQYTVTSSDYTDAAAAVGNGTFKTYSVAQAQAFLEWKYPQATTPANKLVLLTYQFFQSNATPSAGVTVTEAFLLLSSGWQKIYLISPAQYASLGRGVNNGFTSADVTNLPAYFNTFLKADPLVMLAPKVGETKYVTYKYMQSATIVHQKVYVLRYDGTNWTPTATLAFLKKDGKWIPDPTVYYTLVKADYTAISVSNIGTAAGRTNIGSFSTFDITGGTNNWTDTQIQEALILILNTRYPNASVDPSVTYNVTYAVFRSPPPTYTKAFVKTATGFVFVPPAQ